jgi:hypothetical protein
VTEHPKDRPAEPADPFQLFAGGVAGDPRLMLDCLVEEYSRMGYDAHALLRLFEDPEFLATHGLRGLFGADAIRERVREVLARCGVLRVRVSALPRCDPFACHGSDGHA